MILSCFLTLSVGHLALAALQNTATYKGTTLKYYNGQQDTVIFAGAMLACTKKHGELVMPKDRGLNDAVATVAKGQPAWIGGGDLRVENLYEWNDGLELEWASWLSGEPNNQDNEDCMITNWGGKGRWNDDKCCRGFGYVCQIQGSRSQPYEYSAFNTYSKTHAQSYADAKQFCKQRRSRLVSIESNEQLGQLQRALNDSTLTKYWADYKASWKNSCSMVSWNSIHTKNCELSLPFVCEAVSPHDLVVSNEAPEAVEGSVLQIDCSASGFPLPSVAWYRDDVFLPNQDRGEASSTLTLENLIQSDAGLYVCRAVNEIDGEPHQMEGYSILEVFHLN